MGIALHLPSTDTQPPPLSPYLRTPTARLLLEKGVCELTQMIHRLLSLREFDAVALATNVTEFMERDT
jgi:hypothetical protein